MNRFLTMMTMASISMMTMAQEPLSSGLDLTDFDTSVRPGDDFYEYACGGWMKKNPLPAAYSRFGSFDQLQLNNDKRVNAILADLQAGTYENGTVEQKLSDLYKLAMDSVRRNQEGVSPVMPLIQKLEAAKTNQQLLNIQLELAPYGETLFFSASLGADDKNATQNILPSQLKNLPKRVIPPAACSTPKAGRSRKKKSQRRNPNPRRAVSC